MQPILFAKYDMTHRSMLYRILFYAILPTILLLTMTTFRYTKKTSANGYERRLYGRRISSLFHHYR